MAGSSRLSGRQAEDVLARLLAGQPMGREGTQRRDVAPAPRPLNRSARRMIFGAASGPVGAVVVGLAFAVPLAFFFWLFGRESVSDLVMDVRAVPARARVERVEPNWNVRIDRQPLMRVHVSYVHEGRTHRGELRTVDGRVLDEARSGAPLAVEVVPGSPGLVRPAGALVSYVGRWGLLLPALLMASLGLAAGGGLRLLRQVQTFRTGELAWARVTSVVQDGSRTVNRSHPYVVRWEFDVEGRTYTGKLSTLTLPDLQTLLSDGPVPVLYLPGRPQHSVLYVE